MKKTFLTIAVLSGLILVSCTGQKKQADQPVEQTTITAVSDEIVNDSVTNQEGVTLNMTYNNTKGTGTFVLNGETIELQQDTTASGIKFSNAQYEYTEWQGDIVLKKDGKVVFESKK